MEEKKEEAPKAEAAGSRQAGRHEQTKNEKEKARIRSDVQFRIKMHSATDRQTQLSVRRSGHHSVLPTTTSLHPPIIIIPCTSPTHPHAHTSTHPL
jgi:hypothetical protein